MKTNTLTVNLEQAKNWYKSNIPELRELALSLFKEFDLESVKNITTFEEVLDELGMDFHTLVKNCRTQQESQKSIVEAINVALGGNYERIFNVGDIMYYPVVSLTKSFNNKDTTVIVNNIPYKFIYTVDTVVIGKSIIPHYELLCSSLEIATQMGKYFTKEVFELQYYDVLNYTYANKVKH